MGMFLRRGKAPYLNCEITLTGTFSSSYCYATIGGVKYTESTEMIVPRNTEVVIYVSDRATTGVVPTNGEVTLNGEPMVVEDFRYTYTVKKPTTFTFSYQNGYDVITSSCAITTS